MRKTVFLLLSHALGILFLRDGTNGEEYLMSVVADSSGKPAGVDFVTGEAGGWVQVQSFPQRILPSYHYEAHTFTPSVRTVSGIEDKSILVNRSSDNIEMHGWYGYGKFSPLPISALGTKYIVSSCHPSGGYTSVLVIATHSLSTDVDITFRLQGNVTYEGRMYSDKDTLTLSLQKYQTFTIRSDFDLTGTVVNTIQTVAVFSGTLYDDNLVANDQLLPMHHYGQEFIAAVDDNPSLYRLQIVSEYSDTRITFSDTSTVKNDKVGSYRLTKNANLYFTSDSPVMATLCRESEKRSAFVVVPPTSLYPRKINIYTYMYKRYSYKILSSNEVNDIVVRSNGTARNAGGWGMITGTQYKVGTRTPPKYDIVSITSNTRFNIFVFNEYLSFNGGYDFSDTSSNKGTSDTPGGTAFIILVGIVVAVVAVILVAVIACVIVWKRRSVRRKKSVAGQKPNKDTSMAKNQIDMSVAVDKQSSAAGHYDYIDPSYHMSDELYSSANYLQIIEDPNTENTNAGSRRVTVGDSYEPVKTYEFFMSRDKDGEYTKLQV